MRTWAQTDRDRILYTSALRRLAGVTQVVSAVEGHVFHNRLTHSLEVAQIARRLAERLSDSGRIVLDADVAEAAALAHDVGHPPFGHAGETALNELVKQACREHAGMENADGFEGNAQSFRILTRLAAHRVSYRGLNLARATLNAVLKYPWTRGDGPDPAKSEKKYGAYESEREILAWARDGAVRHQKSLEAEVMNFADDVAYSVHDLDDFYRAGLIPLEDLAQPALRNQELRAFRASDAIAEEVFDRYEDNLRGFIDSRFTFGRFQGTMSDRAGMRGVCSRLISYFVSGLSVDETGDAPKLTRDPAKDVQMKFLQNFVWRHVIEGERLARKQVGQVNVITRLFECYFTSIFDAEKRQLHPKTSLQRRVIPAAFRADVDDLETGGLEPGQLAAAAARIACDIVSGYADAQALSMFATITGTGGTGLTDGSLR